LKGIRDMETCFFLNCSYIGMPYVGLFGNRDTGTDIRSPFQRTRGGRQYDAKRDSSCKNRRGRPKRKNRK